MQRHSVLKTLTLTIVLSALASGADLPEPTSPAKALAAAVAHATKRGFPPLPPEKQPEYQPTEADRSRGFAVFGRNVNLRLYPESVPVPEERTPAVYTYGARGETLSVQVALRTFAALEGVTVRATDLRGPKGAAISADRIRCRWIEYAPIREARRRRRRPTTRSASTRPARFSWTGGSRTVPLRIRSMRPLNLPADWTQGWWFTVRIPADAKPGRYEGHVEFLVDGNAVHDGLFEHLNIRLDTVADVAQHHGRALLALVLHRDPEVALSTLHRSSDP